MFVTKKQENPWIYSCNVLIGKEWIFDVLCNMWKIAVLQCISLVVLQITTKSQVLQRIVLQHAALSSQEDNIYWQGITKFDWKIWDKILFDETWKLFSKTPFIFQPVSVVSGQLNGSLSQMTNGANCNSQVRTTSMEGS